jgi:hypothetical protein
LARNVKEDYPELLDVLFDALDVEHCEMLEKLDGQAMEIPAASKNTLELVDSDGNVVTNLNQLSGGGALAKKPVPIHPPPSSSTPSHWRCLSAEAARPPVDHRGRYKSIGKVLPGEKVKNKQYWEQQSKLPPKSERIKKAKRNGSPRSDRPDAEEAGTSAVSSKGLLTLELDEGSEASSDVDLFEEVTGREGKRKSPGKDEASACKRSRTSSEEEFSDLDDSSDEERDADEQTDYSQDWQLRRRSGIHRLLCVRLEDFMWLSWAYGTRSRCRVRGKLKTTAVLSEAEAINAAAAVCSTSVSQGLPRALPELSDVKILPAVVRLPKLKMNSLLCCSGPALDDGIRQHFPNLGSVCEMNNRFSDESRNIVIQILKETVDTLLTGKA